MKPYTFPEMPVGETAKKKEKTDTKSVFTRIFRDDTSTCDVNDMPVGEVSENIDLDIKHIEEKGYLEGFEKGEREGFESARDRIQSLSNSLKEGLLELQEVERQIRLNCEREAVELSLAIARKIVCQEVATDKNIVVNVVKEALGKVVDHKEVKIRLSPADMLFINDIKSKIQGLTETFEKVLFEGDESIMSGGCKIDTTFGDIDARIDRQLQAVEEVFNAEIKKRGLGV
jgi:flagellar assembly protein FliH